MRGRSKQISATRVLMLLEVGAETEGRRRKVSFPVAIADSPAVHPFSRDNASPSLVPCLSFVKGAPT